MKNFLRNLNEVFATPMWLLMRLFVVLIPNHPWRKKRIPLSDWTRNRTQTMIEIDLTFWVGLFVATAVLKKVGMI